MVGDALAVPSDDPYWTKDEFNECRDYARVVSFPPLLLFRICVSGASKERLTGEVWTDVSLAWLLRRCSKGSSSATSMSLFPLASGDIEKMWI